MNGKHWKHSDLSTWTKPTENGALFPFSMRDRNSMMNDLCIDCIDESVGKILHVATVQSESFNSCYRWLIPATCILICKWLKMSNFEQIWSYEVSAFNQSRLLYWAKQLPMPHFLSAMNMQNRPIVSTFRCGQSQGYGRWSMWVCSVPTAFDHKELLHLSSHLIRTLNVWSWI